MFVARKYTEKAMNWAERICVSLENFDFLSSLLPFLFDQKSGLWALTYCIYEFLPKNISHHRNYDKILILHAIDEWYLMPILRQEVT